MNLSQFAGAIAITSGLFSAGCLGTADDLEAAALEQPRLNTLIDPAGTTGSNGLHPDTFHAYKLQLEGIMNQQITINNYASLNVDVATSSIFATPEGSETFRYAVQCGVPDNISWQHPNHLEYKPYKGFGILDTNWDDAGLSGETKRDLFACMMAHLNPTVQDVDIRLTGDKIPDTNGDIVKYSFEEALWVATPTSVGGYYFDVWPLPDLSNKCGTFTSQWLKYRICSQDEATCNLKIHPVDSFTKDCTPPTLNHPHYTCQDHNGQGQPAIRTLLETDGWDTLYPPTRCTGTN